MANKKQQQQQQASASSESGNKTTSSATEDNNSNNKKEKQTTATTKAKSIESRVPRPLQILIITLFVLVLLSCLGILILAGCFTHSHSIAKYRDIHSKIENLQEGKQSRSLSWLLFSNQQKDEDEKGEKNSNNKKNVDLSFVSQKNLVCRDLVVPHIFPLFFSSSTSNNNRKFLDKLFFEADENKLTFLQKSVRVIFGLVRKISFLGSKVVGSFDPYDLHDKKTDWGLKKYSMNKKKILFQQQDSTKNNFFVCKFARGSGNNNNKNEQQAAATVQISQLLDYLVFSEMFEIFNSPNFVEENEKSLLTFAEYLEAESEASMVLSATTTTTPEGGEKKKSGGGVAGEEQKVSSMFNYLRYLYYFNHQGEDNIKKNKKNVKKTPLSSSSTSSSSTLIGDSTFLGEFLNGFLLIPHENGVERIRFAVPPSRLQDGFVDCCDASDEDYSSSSSSSSDENNSNKKKKAEREQHKSSCRSHLRFSVDKVKTKLSKLERAYQICLQRGKENKPKLKGMRLQLEQSKAEFEPQWMQLIQQYEHLHLQLDQMHPVVSAPGAKEQDVQKFNQMVRQFQEMGQHVQGYQQHRTMLQQFESSLLGNSFGVNGEFLSIFEEEEKENKKKEDAGAGGGEDDENKMESEGGEEQQEQEQRSERSGEEKKPVEFCRKITLSPKQFAGGSAESVSSDSIFQICPFREASSAPAPSPSPSSSEQQKQKQKQEGKEEKKTQWTKMGHFFGSLSFWPTKVFQGRHAFLDVVPQMPSRFAQQKIKRANQIKNLIIDRTQKEDEGFATKYKEALAAGKKKKNQQPQKPVNPLGLLFSMSELIQLKRSTADDSTYLLENLYNRSVQNYQQQYESQKQEFVQKRKQELLTAASSSTKTTSSSEDQKEEQASSSGVGEGSSSQSVSSSPSPPTIPSDEEIATEYPPMKPLHEFVENRWAMQRNFVTDFISSQGGSSIVATDVSFFQFGEKCWQGPSERTLALFYVCGPRDRVVEVREDGKCVYEAIFETPSACCSTSTKTKVDRMNKNNKKQTDENGKEKQEQDDQEEAERDFVIRNQIEKQFGGDLFSSIFATKFSHQDDNTLIKRYGIAELLLKTWLSTSTS